ncbi:hypothetical protein GQX74_001220 [Glossina fuscipes]|nr:hypothetical protein GQX74_001220 [Glossina fuscipes]
MNIKETPLFGFASEIEEGAIAAKYLKDIPVNNCELLNQDNEYERFEITDYDIDNEFNPNRPRKKLSKQQQIYGIWADDSDNEDVQETSGRRSRKGRSGFGGVSKAKRSKDYTAPVNFVAGGIQQSGKKKPVDDGKDDHPITDEEDDLEARPGFGSGAAIIDNDESSDSSNESTEEEQIKNSKTKPMGQPSYRSNVKSLGAWEQHTRGIGAKLLLQMGYEPGKGLGKDLQGIAQPVEAHVRKGRGAIGAYGPETSASVTGKAQLDEDIRDAKEFKEKLNKWKKTDSRSEKNSKKYYYKTVEEVLEKGKRSNFMLGDKISKKLGNVPVIDMTGPEKRVLSGYHALSQSKVQEEDLYDLTHDAQKKTINTSGGFALPELMHNLSLIVNMCEQDIITLDSAEHSASERFTALEQERKQLLEIVRLEEDHIDTLEKALALVNELTSGEDKLTLQRAEQIFIELQQKYAAEYKEFCLDDLAAGVIAPLVKDALKDWQPLENPTLHVDLIRKWRAILETFADPQSLARTNIFDPYSSLIWAGVIPSFRACAEHWQPKNHQIMAALLDCWAPLFPSWILDSVLEQLVLPRLHVGVKSWDPLTDTVPIHIWILPWNSILGHKMEEFIYPTIREKLGNALQAWIPQDRSARAMLTPWKGAFDSQEMEVFLMQHIIPKLLMVLNDFIINPLQQDLEPWSQVWEWHELIPTAQMARMLDKHFFPKWMQVLVLWLNQSPDYVEISNWYTGWKSMLSDDLLNEPNIKEHLRRALEIMHRVTDSVIKDGPSAAPPPPQPPPTPQALVDLQMSGAPVVEFKELVSRKCSERGIIFAPLPGRRELGKQIYRVVLNNVLNSSQLATFKREEAAKVSKNFTNNISQRLKVLLGCQDRPLIFEKRQYGNYWLLKNFIRGRLSEKIGCSEAITYCTNGDYTFFDNLPEVVKRWFAPVSFAIFAPGYDFKIAMDSIQYVRNCLKESQLIQKYVTFHIYFPSRHMPDYLPITEEEIDNWPYDCQSSVKPYENSTRADMYKTKNKLLYPINVGRNIAREAANTHFVFVCDIELFPSKNLIKQFFRMLLHNKALIPSRGNGEEEEEYRVFPVPVFEVAKTSSVPENKAELLKMLKVDLAIPFHKFTCKNCHMVPGYGKWLNRTNVNTMEIIAVSKREGKFASWEPFYISDNREPMFDERVTWEGQSNKRIQNYAMCLLGFKYHVLHPAFLVHTPGIKRVNLKDPRLKYVAPTNALIRKKIIPEYHILYVWLLQILGYEFTVNDDAFLLHRSSSNVFKREETVNTIDIAIKNY